MSYRNSATGLSDTSSVPLLAQSDHRNSHNNSSGGSSMAVESEETPWPQYALGAPPMEDEDRFKKSILLKLDDIQLQAVRWMIATEALHAETYAKIPTNSYSANGGRPIHRVGGILGDAMGLGKTIDCLGLIWYDRMRFPAENRNTLVIVPLSLLCQWQKEATQKFGFDADCDIFIYHGKERVKGLENHRKTHGALPSVILTTYETVQREMRKHKGGMRTSDLSQFTAVRVQNNTGDAMAAAPDKKPDAQAAKNGGNKSALHQKWHRVIVDEAHNLRNSKTEIFQSLLKLQCLAMWCVTGTPIVNGRDDIRSLSLICTPSDPLKINSDDDTVWRNKHMLKRTKEAIHLPELVREIKWISLAQNERRVYTLVEDWARAEISRLEYSDDANNKHYQRMLIVVVRMRQTCDHPMILRGKAFTGMLLEEAKSIMSGLTPADRRFILESHAVSHSIDHASSLPDTTTFSTTSCTPLCPDPTSDVPLQAEPLVALAVAHTNSQPISNGWLSARKKVAFGSRHLFNANAGDSEAMKTSPWRTLPENRKRPASDSIHTTPSHTPIISVTVSSATLPSITTTTSTTTTSSSASSSASTTTSSSNTANISNLLTGEYLAKVTADQPLSNTTAATTPKTSLPVSFLGSTSSRAKRADELELEAETELREKIFLNAIDDLTRDRPIFAKLASKYKTVDASSKIDLLDIADVEEVISATETDSIACEYSENSPENNPDLPNDEEPEPPPKSSRKEKKRLLEQDPDGKSDTKTKRVNSLPTSERERTPERCRSDATELLEALAPSAKIRISEDKLFATLRKNPTDKTVIFSQYTTMLDLIETRLTLLGFGVLRFDGQNHKPSSRTEIVDLFSTDPAYTVLLCSLRAGGVGVNLAAANSVIILDPWWNSSLELQAGDRVHRLGQLQSVVISRLLISDSIEQEVVGIQEKKNQLERDFYQESTDIPNKRHIQMLLKKRLDNPDLPPTHPVMDTLA